MHGGVLMALADTAGAASGPSLTRSVTLDATGQEVGGFGYVAGDETLHLGRAQEPRRGLKSNR